MEKVHIYGEAQLQRSLKEDNLNVVIYYSDDNKSLSLLAHVKTLLAADDVENTNVLLVNRAKLSDQYYMRRGITSTPTVCYYHGKQEYGRMTGLHTLEMLVNNIAKHRKMMLKTAA